MMSGLEEQFLLLWRALAPDRPEPVREYRFHPARRWRLDFAWPDQKVAVEVEGGIWIRGRHQRPLPFTADCEKYNTATTMGWRIFRCTSTILNQNTAAFIAQVAESLGQSDKGPAPEKPRG